MRERGTAIEAGVDLEDAMRGSRMDGSGGDALAFKPTVPSLGSHLAQHTGYSR